MQYKVILDKVKLIYKQSSPPSVETMVQQTRAKLTYPEA